MKQPKSRSVVITGASSGIGAACARHLDALGFHVFASVRRVEDGERLRLDSSPRLTPIILDVTDSTSIAAATQVIASAVHTEGLAGLVNNAGISVVFPLEFVPVETLRQQLEVNVLGQVAVTQSLLPHLRQGNGRIVNIGSIAGRAALPLFGPYAASKFALEAISDALRVELRPWNIHVAIVEPGHVATPIWQRSLAFADQLMDAAPPQIHAFYSLQAHALRTYATTVRGASVDPVVRAVEHALIARRPRRRYLVGLDAVMLVMVGALPGRLRDRIVGQLFSSERLLAMFARMCGV